MLYSNVCVETFAYSLPDEVLTSAQLEQRLAPLYQRLRLPEGRLELMTGIRTRRLWSPRTRPSEAAAAAGRVALAQAGLDPAQVDCLLMCSVSRDFVEPATSTAVHRLLELPAHAVNFDISNACLGVLSGMTTAANMIELGQIDTALVVAGENCRPLLETTIDYLNAEPTLTRRSVKPYFASLTIGSAAAAVVLRRRCDSQSGHRLLGGMQRCSTAFNHLCQGDSSGGMTAGAAAMMLTDSEQLLQHGVALAAATWERTMAELNWDHASADLICTHQVGRAHRELMYQRCGLDMAKDFATVEQLGNCGSASLPLTVGMAVEAGRLQPGDRLAMLGIGSGINCQMLAIQW